MSHIQHSHWQMCLVYVIQTKPRGCIESNEVKGDIPYQVDQMSPP